MGYVMHCRNTPDGKRFRPWSTVSDGYCAGPLSAKQAMAWMMELYRREAFDSATRTLADAAARGDSRHHRTSAAGLDAPWDTERCHECNCFHHTFTASPRGTCSHCGEPEGNVGHGNPCGSGGQ